MNPFESEQNLSDIGVIICGHGSRNKLAVKEFADLVQSIRSRLPDIPVEYGYLEFARPILVDALDKLREKGVTRIIAIPAMLFAAGHSKNDIPSVLNKYSLKYGITINYGLELGINNLMIMAAADKIKNILGDHDDNTNSLLVVIGRGSSDPDANANVVKITRLLVEAFGFGWGETLYSGVTFPLVEPGLRKIISLGYKRIILLPYFLFSGVLVSRVKRHIQLISEENPNIKFLTAEYLGNQSYIVDNFIDRINEVVNGKNYMDCSVCKYRSNLPGFEKEVGLEQIGHHHHVEGNTDSCELCEGECTGICQDQPEQPFNQAHTHSHQHEHQHSHFPYPNKDHPLGPVTLRCYFGPEFKKDSD